MKKKGFTLIELLAVIIILAIVALIATPIILNVINDVRDEADLRTVDGIVDGRKQYCANAMFDSVAQDKINNSYNVYKDITILLVSK